MGFRPYAFGWELQMARGRRGNACLRCHDPAESKRKPRHALHRPGGYGPSAFTLGSIDGRQSNATGASRLPTERSSRGRPDCDGHALSHLANDVI
jgi:hypothetical protein